MNQTMFDSIQNYTYNTHIYIDYIYLSKYLKRKECKEDSPHYTPFFSTILVPSLLAHLLQMRGSGRIKERQSVGLNMKRMLKRMDGRR